MQHRKLLLGAWMLVVFTGCGEVQQATEQVATRVTVAEAESRAADVVVLDVRTPEEYAEGHIEGAINVNVDGDGFEQALLELDPSATYLVHCAANVPNGRSARALTQMASLGFERLQSLEGGYYAWSEAQSERTSE